MRTVVLTNNGSLYGKKILNDFMRNKIPVAAVVVVRNSPAYYRKLFGFVRRRVGLLDGLYFAAQRFFRGRTAPRPAEWRGRPFIGDYRAMGFPLLYARGVNSRRTLAALKELAPDVVILAQTDIVGRELLRIPTIGTLNAHPGILPHYRGIDCAKWAIHNDEFDRVGITVHWVDEGVDTGAVVGQKIYDFAGDETIQSLEDNLYGLCAALLTAALSAVGRGAVPPGERRPPDAGRQYFKMDRKTENQVKKKLQAFLAERPCRD